MESNSKKRILVFIDWFLPGDKAGGPVRSCANLIAHLGKEYDFSVVTRDTDYTSDEPYSGIQSDAWNTIGEGMRVYYISASRLIPQTIRRIIAEERFDYIYLNGVWSQPFTVWPLQELRRSGKKAKALLAVRGMLAPSAMAIKAAKKKTFLLYARFRGIYKGVIFHATNEKEAEETRAVFGRDVSVRVAGNLPRLSSGAKTVRKNKNEILKIVSVARIAPEKNTLYAIEALALVKHAIVADFYGSIYDTAYAESCRTAAEKLPAHISLRFCGPLSSESIASALMQYDLAYLPSRGENFGHVILESMEAGLPVLISDQTPWKQLAGKKAGWELPLADPLAFAARIDAVAQMTDAEYAEWSAGALRFAEAYAHDPSLTDASRKLFS